MSNPKPSFLREYNGYNFLDAGPVESGDPGDCVITVSKDSEVVNKVFYNTASPANLNKAIEKAKEWVDVALKGETGGGKAPADRYSDKQLEEFKSILESKKQGAQTELARLRELAKKPQNDSTESSSDEKIEAKNAVQLIARQEKFIDHLDEALGRIANKTYGICRITGKLIAADRLRAIPHATLSQEAKDSMNKDKVERAPEVPEKKIRKKREKAKEHAEPAPKLRTCRACGCTDNNCQQCIDKTGSPCHWVEEDLCSACVEVPEIKVTDERAAATETSEDPATEVVNISGFFKQLASAGEIDLTLRMKSKADKITVELIPAGKSLHKPILVTGTPEDLDEGFCSAIIPKFNEISGLKHNLDDVKTHVKEKVDKKAEEKPAQKKRGPKPKKPVHKYKQKQTKKVKEKPATAKPEPKKRGRKPKVKAGPPELPGLTETIKPSPEPMQAQDPITETNS